MLEPIPGQQNSIREATIKIQPKSNICRQKKLKFYFTVTPPPSFFL